LEVEEVWEGHVTPHWLNCPEVYTVEVPANTTFTTKAEQEEEIIRRQLAMGIRRTKTGAVPQVRFTRRGGIFIAKQARLADGLG
jgi:hypothetical protein